MDDADDFLMMFPVWVIAISPKGDPETGLEIEGLHGGQFDNKGAGYLPVFTDEDLLQRYMAQASLDPDMKPVAFRRPGDFLNFLRSIRKADLAQAIAFDVTNHKTTVRVPIEELIDAVARQLRTPS